ncbi:hypothetical protein KKH82_08290 [Patescibacteria group bacterium]|nr:hypothetical protein [Patescibacteria group bacterium]
MVACEDRSSKTTEDVQSYIALSDDEKCIAEDHLRVLIPWALAYSQYLSGENVLAEYGLSLGEIQDSLPGFALEDHARLIQYVLGPIREDGWGWEITQDFKDFLLAHGFTFLGGGDSYCQSDCTVISIMTDSGSFRFQLWFIVGDERFPVLQIHSFNWNDPDKKPISTVVDEDDMFGMMPPPLPPLPPPSSPW